MTRIPAHRDSGQKNRDSQGSLYVFSIETGNEIGGRKVEPAAMGMLADLYPGVAERIDGLFGGALRGWTIGCSQCRAGKGKKRA
jgi:hypothetical protein